MRKDKKFGKCHICGIIGKLSFEHVPPKKAFNSRKVLTVSGDEMLLRQDIPPWEMSGRKLEQIQQGYGGHTLCNQCNNDTGSWYAPPFFDFVEQAARQLRGNELVANTQMKLSFKSIMPLRVAKQIVTCFASINSNSLFDSCESLRNFVLDREHGKLDSRSFGIYCYVLVGSLARYVGKAAMIDMNRGYTFLSEFAHRPFGYVLEFDPGDLLSEQYCDISFFANKYTLDEKIDLELEIPIRASESPLPGHHSTRAELERVLKK